MKNAFLVSDEDLRSLRSEPWFIELNGPAVFLHESVLKLLQQQAAAGANQPKLTTVNGAYDAKGRPLTCDQPACPRNLADRAFPTFMARQTHRALLHKIPGEYYKNHKRYPKKLQLTETPKLPAPNSNSAETAERVGAKSYDYQEFDAKGVCGICEYANKIVRALHFHRSVAHKIRGINWHRPSHKKLRRGRPRKVA